MSSSSKVYALVEVKIFVCLSFHGLKGCEKHAWCFFFCLVVLQ